MLETESRVERERILKKKGKKERIVPGQIARLENRECHVGVWNEREVNLRARIIRYESKVDHWLVSRWKKNIYERKRMFIEDSTSYFSLSCEVVDQWVLPIYQPARSFDGEHQLRPVAYYTQQDKRARSPFLFIYLFHNSFYLFWESKVSTLIERLIRARHRMWDRVCIGFERFHHTVDAEHLWKLTQIPTIRSAAVRLKVWNSDRWFRDTSSRRISHFFFCCLFFFPLLLGVCELWTVSARDPRWATRQQQQQQQHLHVTFLPRLVSVLLLLPVHDLSAFLPPWLAFQQDPGHQSRQRLKRKSRETQA